MVFFVTLLIILFFTALSYITIHLAHTFYKRLNQRLATQQKGVDRKLILYGVALLLFGFLFFQNLFVAMEWFTKNDGLSSFGTQHYTLIGYLCGGVAYFAMKKLKK
ncbi:hypothetical protein J7S27_04020 [Carnobacteriaceae bacterium zg-C25]|nr:hypothetical protein J7S27_04020 [Carnobacteriaceae bacterium zg-C25]